MTSETVTSSEVIRALPGLLRARVMTRPRLSDGWAGDTGTQTVPVCLKYSVSSFQALGSPLSQSPNTQLRPLKQESSILENAALSTGSLDWVQPTHAKYPHHHHRRRSRPLIGIRVCHPM